MKTLIDVAKDARKKSFYVRVSESEIVVCDKATGWRMYGVPMPPWLSQALRDEYENGKRQAKHEIRRALGIIE